MWPALLAHSCARQLETLLVPTPQQLPALSDLCSCPLQQLSLEYLYSLMVLPMKLIWLKHPSTALYA